MTTETVQDKYYLIGISMVGDDERILEFDNVEDMLRSFAELASDPSIYYHAFRGEKLSLRHSQSVSVSVKINGEEIKYSQNYDDEIQESIPDSEDEQVDPDVEST